MSSDELQRASGNRAKDSSEMNYGTDSLPSTSIERSLDTKIQPTEKQSIFPNDSKKGRCEIDTSLDISPSSSKPLISAMEENKLIHQGGEGTSSTTASSIQLYEKPHSSNLSTPQTKKDEFLNSASKSELKAGESSNVARPAPFKGFPIGPSDVPFTKEKLAESLSLEEACGFLPSLMKTKRLDLKSMEIQMDQISTDLQVALRDAKNICILMENVPCDTPRDINAARVQAQKLMYLLSSSFRIFKKLDHLGKTLKEVIEGYSKQTGEYHSSIDILLDFIMENILEKCKQIETRKVN